jgi:hypothetical protein
MGFSAYRQTGLTHNDGEGTYDGYTLITPQGGSKTLLLNMEGRIVHAWEFTDILPGYGRLLDNGNLLLRGVERDLWDEDTLCWIEGEEGDEKPSDDKFNLDIRVREMGANASLIREVDWDGNVVWEYKNKRIHHDFVKTANGHAVLVEWVELPAEVEAQVAGGLPKSPNNTLPMLGDEIFELDAEGNELWRVKLWELHDPIKDPICPLEPRTEWTHLNSLDVNERGDVLFSCRNNSRVGIIDGETKKLVWNYGQPNIFHQHHATFLPNGNVQIFDNGMHRHGVPRSRVIEVDTKTDEIVWEYLATPEIQFFSAHISGADRLPNGNVLICEGAPGRIFEITLEGRVVWEWVNPIVQHVRGGPSHAIFRAHRYDESHKAISGRGFGDNKAVDELNAVYGL